jgi:hypothetical protein
MIDMERMDDFPKLIPDESIRFDEKEKIRRSPEMDFECTESEYNDIVAEEKLAEQSIFRLTPDTRTVMSNKKSLKHRTSGHRLLWLSIATTAAAVALLLVTTRNRTADLPADITVVKSMATIETATVAEVKPETATETKPKIVVAKKNKPKSMPVEKSVSETIPPQTTELDMPTEISESKRSSPENAPIERIAPIAVPVEMMKKQKTVFVYQPDYHEDFAFRAIVGISSIAEKLAADVDETKQSIAQKIEGFRLTNILSRLTLDRGIDREIEQWAKEHPDIPFTVFIDDMSENKMTEIYDENGTLTRVVFFTNRSVKYHNNQTYQASSNRRNF